MADWVLTDIQTETLSREDTLLRVQTIRKHLWVWMVRMDSVQFVLYYYGNLWFSICLNEILSEGDISVFLLWFDTILFVSFFSLLLLFSVWHLLFSWSFPEAWTRNKVLGRKLHVRSWKNRGFWHENFKCQYWRWSIEDSLYENCFNLTKLSWEVNIFIIN